jgi:hypothetical protein
VPDLGDRLHELYGLPLDEFTAARNALAKELTRAGDKEAAAEVKRLPKPNKTAGILNQLARRRPDAVAKLLEAGNELRKAQEQALRGDASRLRPASRAEQAVVEELVEATAAIDPTVDQERVRRTLRAAAADVSVGGLLREGRLLADAETSGFGLDAFADTVLTAPARASGRASTAKAPAKAPANKADPAPPEPDRKAEREAQEREAQERAQREARREAERLAKEAAVEANRAQRRREEADRAETQAREARRKADEATARAEEAQRRAEDAARRAGALA